MLQTGASDGLLVYTMLSFMSTESEQQALLQTYAILYRSHLPTTARNQPAPSAKAGGFADTSIPATQMLPNAFLLQPAMTCSCTFTLLTYTLVPR